MGGIFWCVALASIANTAAQTRVHVEYENLQPAPGVTVKVFDATGGNVVGTLPPTDQQGNTFFSEPPSVSAGYFLQAVRDGNHFSEQEEVRWHLPAVAPTLTIRAQGGGAEPNRTSWSPCQFDGPFADDGYVACSDLCSPCGCSECVPCFCSGCCACPAVCDVRQCLGSPCDASAFPSNSGNAKFVLSLPEGAIVYVNGKRTRNDGERREYVSPGLQRGLTYTYSVRAEVLRNGVVLSETHKIVLRAGQHGSIAFSFDSETRTQLAAYGGVRQ
jgi:uncharacterized protein (TIGR03000 family)